jgi:hypothetical protein
VPLVALPPAHDLEIQKVSEAAVLFRVASQKRLLRAARAAAALVPPHFRDGHPHAARVRDPGPAPTKPENQMKAGLTSMNADALELANIVGDEREAADVRR